MHPSEHLSTPFHVADDTCSPYCGFIPFMLDSYRQISYIYILTSEQLSRGNFRTVNGSIHIYSIYHRLMHPKLPT